jgi:lantibiotic biosynthesis protein
MMETIDKSIFLEAAWSIGCQLMRDCIWHNKLCNWQGYSIEPLNGMYQPVIKTFGPDLYSGTSGIALFLSALYKEREDAILLKTIEGCMAQVQATVDTIPNQGFYSGKVGIAVTFIQIGKQFQRKDWVNDGVQILKRIPTSTLAQHEMDLISGAASTIPILLDAYQEFKKAEFLDKAIALGNLLCAKASKNGPICSWATVPSQKHLTGFSHGASGIALALLQLYVITNNEIYLYYANGGFNYERQSFDAEQQNWPDNRDDVVQQTSKPVCGVAWCHGAPGIALSRLKAKQIKQDALFEQEMEIALRTTTASVYTTLTNNLSNTNYSLCHGNAGNADILLECGGVEHKKLAAVVGTIGINKYLKNDIPWPTGLNTGDYTPGLMMGVAGTGYFYLRLMDATKHKILLLPSL